MPDFTTISGGEINYGDLQHSDIQLDDLLHQSMGIRRYLAVIDVTLATHLVLCAELVKLAVPLTRSPWGRIQLHIAAGYAAAHDLHECLVGDCPTKLKKYLPDYRALEAQAEARVHEAIGLPITCCPTAVVKSVDKRALEIEATVEGHPFAKRDGYLWVPVSSAEHAAYARAHAVASDRTEYYAYMRTTIELASKELQKTNVATR